MSRSPLPLFDTINPKNEKAYYGPTIPLWRLTIMSINIVGKADDLVTVKNILISVSDKSGLEELVCGLAGINPDISILSTGGTFSTVQKILGDKAKGRLTQVAAYTGQPETQGGLVKTLDFKIYLGLLTETYNTDHANDLARTGAITIDMVVVNLYPFAQTIARPDTTPEQARGNIDIGGPCMLRAAAKNFIRVTPVVNPSDYTSILAELRETNGKISLKTRFTLARKAFAHTAVYDRAVADYLGTTAFDDIKKCYTFNG
jgi:phosphoribosylaminoimidazolecarboxamide formyltransferase/IMP cyclohydrolase